MTETDPHTEPQPQPSAPPIEPELVLLEELRKELASVKRKLNKMSKAKPESKKDFWDIFGTLSSFVSSCVIAVIGLTLTINFNRSSRYDQQRMRLADSILHQRQLEISAAELDLQSLKGTIDLIPLITNKDTNVRAKAQKLLTYFQSQTSSAQGVSGTFGGGQVRTMNVHILLAMILDKKTAPADKDKLTSQLGSLAQTGQPEEKTAAVSGLTRIATDQHLPESTRHIAQQILDQIKSIVQADIGPYVAGQPLHRAVSEIILHHTFFPGKAEFDGIPSLKDRGAFELSAFEWQQLSWHFAVAPDGKVWLGAPIDQAAVHTGGHNQHSVSVYLILNGDEEMPSPEQERSLATLLKALQQKTHIDLRKNFSEHSGFHSDYTGASCPGKNITKAYVLGLLARGG